MRIPIFIQKLFNKVTKAKFFFVTLDICPDFNTGQGEMVSYTVKANDATTASYKATRMAMNEWNISINDTYVVECIETADPELIYDR